MPKLCRQRQKHCFQSVAEMHTNSPCQKVGRERPRIRQNEAQNGRANPRHPFFSDLFLPVMLQLRRMAPTAILVLLQPSQTPVDMRG